MSAFESLLVFMYFAGIVLIAEMGWIIYLFVSLRVDKAQHAFEHQLRSLQYAVADGFRTAETARRAGLADLDIRLDAIESAAKLNSRP